jgi:hypothetical protein
MTKKIKISLRPEGPGWVWEHFMDHIVDPLRELGLLRLEQASTKYHVAGISIFQNGEWQREYMGKTSCLMLAEFAQNLGMPMVIENGDPYYVMDEKDAVVEYLKHGAACHNR